MKYLLLKLSALCKHLHQGFGVFSNKDWRINVFTIICTVGILFNLIMCLFINYNPCELYCSALWLILLIYCRVKGSDSFLVISILFCVFIICTNEVQNSSITIFLVMVLQLSKNNKQRVWCLSSLFIFSVIKHSLSGIQLVYIFAIFIEFSFSLLCYYGFFYIVNRKNKKESLILATEKEAKILDSTIWEDKSMKEIAYELGMSYSALMNCLKRCRERNHYNTTEAMVRDYKVQQSSKKE